MRRYCDRDSENWAEDHAILDRDARETYGGWWCVDTVVNQEIVLKSEVHREIKRVCYVEHIKDRIRRASY